MIDLPMVATAHACVRYSVHKYTYAAHGAFSTCSPCSVDMASEAGYRQRQSGAISAICNVQYKNCKHVDNVYQIPLKS